MSDRSLLKQLADRCHQFHRHTGISQIQMAKAIGMADGNYSAFLAGKRGIGPEAICRLLEFTGLTREQAIAKFSKPVFSASIINLQEKGQKIHFSNDGWIANENSTDDPARSGGTDITSTPRARTEQVANLTSMFQDLDYVTRKSVIDAFIVAHATSNTIPTTQKFRRRR